MFCFLKIWKDYFLLFMFLMMFIESWKIFYVDFKLNFVLYFFLGEECLIFYFCCFYVFMFGVYIRVYFCWVIKIIVGMLIIIIIILGVIIIIIIVRRILIIEIIIIVVGWVLIMIIYVFVCDGLFGWVVFLWVWM